MRATSTWFLRLTLLCAATAAAPARAQDAKTDPVLSAGDVITFYTRRPFREIEIGGEVTKRYRMYEKDL